MIDSGPDICQSLVTLQILRCNVASLVGMAVLFVRPVASSRIIFFSYQGRTANKGILENSACIAGRLYSSLHCVAFSTSPAGSLRCVIVALVHWFVNPLLPQSFHCYFNPHLERLISISVMPTFRFFRFFSFHPRQLRIALHRRPTPASAVFISLPYKFHSTFSLRHFIGSCR